MIERYDTACARAMAMLLVSVAGTGFLLFSCDCATHFAHVRVGQVRLLLLMLIVLLLLLLLVGKLCFVLLLRGTVVTIRLMMTVLAHIETCGIACVVL